MFDENDDKISNRMKIIFKISPPTSAIASTMKDINDKGRDGSPDTLAAELVAGATTSKGSTMGTSDRSESGNLAGVFAGALVGVGIALLFAPQAGAQLRRFLRDSAACARGEVNDVVDRSTEVVDSAVAHGQEVVEKGKQSLRETGRQAKEFAMAGGKAFNETKDELASLHR